MAYLQPNAVGQLVDTTWDNVKKGKWVDLSLSLTEYFAMPRFMKRETVNEEDGPNLTWKTNFDTSSAAQTTGLYATITRTRAGRLVTATIPWRNAMVYFQYDERDYDLNRGPHQIISQVQVDTHRMWNSMAALLETQFWSLPTSTTNDFYGLPYWCIRNTTVTKDSAVTVSMFNAENPSGFSGGRAGIDSTASGQSAWANAAAQYTNISESDLVKLMVRGTYMTTFIDPNPYPNLDTGRPRCEWFCGYGVHDGLRSLLISRNEFQASQLQGRELSWGAGSPGQPALAELLGQPIYYAPILNSATGAPVYRIDWSVFHCVAKTGWNMKVKPARESEDQPNVWFKDVFYMGNIRCYDPRRLIVLSTS